MKVDDFTANARMQADIKAKAKEEILHAQIESVLAERPALKTGQPNQLNDAAVKAAQEAQDGEE
ncbi:hypothetical protein [Chelativorans alearense]|uniref:hypothetical protein n=1 Tax=Chelativorans alearense TaxID=2681495 RepID=UPI0013D0CFF8|nr:hypothetical protein [Chelativorans alearense]